MKTDLYIYKKNIDWSTLNYGFNIPVTHQLFFKEMFEGNLEIGAKFKIYLLIDGEKYSATLTNIDFDRIKYPKHKELIQIRYSNKSKLAIKLKDIFKESYDHFFHARDKTDKRIVTNSDEFFSLYTTFEKDTFYLDYFVSSEVELLKKSINITKELDFETSSNYFKSDHSAGYIEKDRLIKIRKLDYSICNNLKELYSNKCQICGKNHGLSYNAVISEAHHIIPFTKSMNNDSDNLIILCPNHHRIIHNVEPVFDRKKLSFMFKNGLVERIALNKHL
ncbi:MAG TPA: HNH endonuclease signature motif containing protein [Clostridiales bacterium]|nr:HNH endonuclease signature motif containing protein [Clostridiales bacterium]